MAIQENCQKRFTAILENCQTIFTCFHNVMDTQKNCQKKITAIQENCQTIIQILTKPFLTIFLYDHESTYLFDNFPV